MDVEGDLKLDVMETTIDQEEANTKSINLHTAQGEVSSNKPDDTQEMALSQGSNTDAIEACITAENGVVVTTFLCGGVIPLASQPDGTEDTSTSPLELYFDENHDK